LPTSGRRTKKRKKKATCTPCAESGNSCNGNNPCSMCILQNLQCKFSDNEVTEAPEASARKRKQSDLTHNGGRRKKMRTTTTEGGELEDDHSTSSKQKSSQDSLEEDDDDTMDETPLAGVDSSAAPAKSRRPARQRKTSVKVLRALEDEQESKEPKKKKFRSKAKSTDGPASDPSATAAGGEDPLLEVEKIHLQRYNPTIKEMEFLTQHKGFDIHRSIWLTRTALTGNEKFISEFQTYWKAVAASKDNSGFPVGQNVWVKLRGHPWWPARVVQSKTVATKQHDYIVTFYGDNTFGFVNDYTPGQFVVEKFDDPDKHKKSHNLEAIQQVLTLVPDDPEGEHENGDSKDH